MPARDANRGRGGGRGRAGNPSDSGGGRKANTGGSSASTRGGASASGGARATSGASGGATSAAGRSGSGSREGRGAAAQSRKPQTGLGGRATGASTGIGGGDVASGGIAITGGGASSAPRAADVDAALFGASSPSDAAPAAERQRELEPIRETSDATRPAASAGATEPATRVAGRPRAGRGLAGWLAAADNPFAMMRRMQEELDSVFRAFGVPRPGAALVPPRELEELLARAPALSQTAQWSPQIEVFERDGALVVHADLPGVKRDDVEVNVDNDVLTIRGQRRQESRDSEGGYRRTERSYGSFFRQIPLPDGVDPTEIEAAYEDGVLEVIVPAPRTQQPSRRRVDIR